MSGIVGPSLVAALLERLDAIQARMTEVFRSSRVEQHIQPGNPFAALSGRQPKPKISYRWAPLNTDLENEQARILSTYAEWYGEFAWLISDTSERTQRSFSTSNQAVSVMIRVRSYGQFPRTAEAAVQQFSALLAPFYDYLRELKESQSETILVPDTNVLIDQHDVTLYGAALGVDAYKCVVTPVVLAELDELKIKRTDKEFRNRVSRAIRYLRSWREKGDVLLGVALAPGITGQMMATEPDFDALPDWLDPSINDDRMVASALTIRRCEPAATVSVISNDLNLANKCSLAGIACHEVPSVSDDAA